MPQARTKDATFMPMKPHARRRTKDIIWSAILELDAREQVITREVLREVTGYELTTVDEHIKRFIEEDESLRRVKSGVFQLIPAQPPTRAVGLTIEQPSGMVTVRVGDQSLSVSHREAQILALQLAGFAQRTQAQFTGDEARAVTLI